MNIEKNYIHECKELKEYKNTNEAKYKKNKYSNDEAKTKQNLPEVTVKEISAKKNLNKYRKRTYDKEKEIKSNISSRIALATVAPNTSQVTGAIAPFWSYGIAALVLILIVLVLIILYIWLYRRRKNSWKYEWKKHLCT
ncbi:PIR protein, pseudogene, putative [Plasmodium sp.]|nr:PIR protein, pseudogene, putative [Plasmodium sp.]